MNPRPFFRYRTHKDYGFTLHNYHFRLMLQRIKPKYLLDIFKALLLERKVILVQDRFEDNAVIIESLLSLLTPFKWNFVQISYLTKEVVGMCEAPMPYIIGATRETWELMQSQRNDFDLEGVLMYDIDNHIMKNIKGLPPLPEPCATMLTNHLHDILNTNPFATTIDLNTPHTFSDQEFFMVYIYIYIYIYSTTIIGHLLLSESNKYSSISSYLS